MIVDSAQRKLVMHCPSSMRCVMYTLSW